MTIFPVHAAGSRRVIQDTKPLIHDPGGGHLSPTTGQFAERQGRQAAENIVRVLQGEATRPFFFKPLGQVCGIGERKAVAEMFGVRLSGFPTWWLW